MTTAAIADIARGEFPPQITDIYNDLDGWLAAAPEVATIDFIGLLDGEHIDDEFADLGVQFTGGFYTAIDNTGLDNDTFVDDFGLDGNSTTIVMEFDQPFNVFGVLFPGRMQLMFYLDGGQVFRAILQAC